MFNFTVIEELQRISTALIDIKEENQRQGALLNTISPVLASTTARLFNPFKTEIVTASVLTFQRKQFAKTVPVHKRKERKKLLIKCMVAQVFGDGDQVVASHIIPRSTDGNILQLLQLTLFDVNSARNILFLCKNIEVAYDKLWISFIQKDVLHPTELLLVINNERARKLSVYEGATSTIGDLEGTTLILNGHNPFLRCLSYQAYLAYEFSENKSVSSMPIEYGSPESNFAKFRRCATNIFKETLKNNFETALKHEIMNENDEDDDSDNSD